MSRGKQSRIKVVLHPLYGKIPLIGREVRDRQGRTHVMYDYDPDHTPKLPRGAVRGDIRKQDLCFACHVPKYFYVDEDRTCVQCGRGFTFRAAEQKFWYESLGFYGTSVAIRCLECRRKQRSEKTLRAQIASARYGVKANREDAAAWLALAEAIVRYHQRTGQGDLNEAIASSRRARKLTPLVTEAMFWEALCHVQSGRKAKARPLLERFISRPARSKRDRDLKREGKKLLQPDGSLERMA